MAWDPIWEAIYRERPWGKYPTEDLIRFVARRFYHLPDRKQVRLLEVGFGKGANVWYLAREGFSVSGVEGSPQAVAAAKARLDAECPGWSGELFCGDILHLPFANSSFEAVIDVEAVYCNSYDESRRIYSEMARVCKPGGWLFSRTFANSSWGDGSGEPRGRHAWLPTEGPLAGTGMARFTAEGEIEDLVRPFRVCELEEVQRTEENRSRKVREWVIVGQKCA